MAVMLPTMNRQLRRAQAKQDDKAEREKARKKQARRQKIAQIKGRRAANRTVKKMPGAKPEEPAKTVHVSQMTAEQRKKMPGRFSGALMIATVFFIILQAAVPTDDANVMSSLTGAGFFLMFGYFSTLFLFRRGSDKAFNMTLTSGLALAAGVLATRFFGENAGFDTLFLLMVGLGAVGVVAGAYLGRAVFFAGRTR